jgi:8-amino-7-oxononanoate synthase
MDGLEETLRRYLDGLEAAGRLRRLRVPPGGVDFSSNDYLGLARHPELVRRACAWAERYGAGSRASRLVTGNIQPFPEIEAKIARLKGTEAALVMVSGFQANASILPALLDEALWGARPQVFADRLNHASMHLGCQAAGVRQTRYRHNDLGHLESLLAKAPPGPKFILAETVFSMDGDRADVAGLAALAKRHGAFLYLDEAHATGVLGEGGAGLAHGHEVDLVMGTFSKALGGFGAYVACSALLRETLANRCAGLIYATALPPAVLGAMDAALDLLPRLDAERARVLGLAERARRGFRAAGLDTGPSTTQIVPVMLGTEERALAVARGLEAEGLLAVAIRPPTVPRGASRIRFTFSAAHDEAEVDRLIAAVTRLAAP